MSQKHKHVLKLLLPLELGATHDQDLALEGDLLDQAQAGAGLLLKNVFADSTYELLSDWERVLALVPEDDASVTARVAACVAKLRELGGLSIPYFIQLAEAMGYEIEIFEPQPFMAGVGMAGYPVYIAGIIWCWRVDVQEEEYPAYYFRAGQSGAGDPLMDFGLLDLETVFNELKPAHTFVYFTYPEV
jgi:uncharacterized protein YmfQ (DUF2313 family)